MESVDTVQKELIKGLGRIIRNNIASGHVVLLSGSPGSLKSLFSLHYASRYLECSGKSGLYVTLEQSTDSHMKSLESVGILKSENLIISDYNSIKRDFKDEKEYEVDIISSIRIMISKLKRDINDGLSFFVLDSINALYAFSKMKAPRIQIHGLFNFLREQNLASMIIKEDSDVLDSEVNESYLVDGIIKLGFFNCSGNVKRFIEVKKMRGSWHDLRKYEMEIGNNDISISEPFEIAPK